MEECFGQVLLYILPSTSWQACDGGCSDLNAYVAYFHLCFWKALLARLTSLSVLLMCFLETLALKGILICQNFCITLGCSILKTGKRGKYASYGEKWESEEMLNLP